MALKAGRYGVTKDQLLKIESGGGGTTVVANPEGAATADLTKLKVGDTIYGVDGDTSDCYKTSNDTESAIVDADYIPFLDSSAASGEGAPKKSTWTNFCNKIQAKLNVYLEQTVTLGTSDTTVTFTDALITADSIIDVYAGRSAGDVSGSQNAFPYKSIYTTAGSCTILFPALDSSVSAKVRIYLS